MASAREQAREAASSLAPSPDSLDRIDAAFGKFAATAADAASDIWEPLLRDMVEAYEHALRHGTDGHHGLIPWGAHTRAKEALGA